MVKKIQIENFFSFGKSEIILNQDTNILLGINGSGKSNLLKAIRLLYEGVEGKDGFEKLFLEDWGGFTSVGNFSGIQSDGIKLSFEFDKEAITESSDNKGFKFSKNPVYEIEIKKVGETAYYFKEKIYYPSSEEGKGDFLFIEMENGKGTIPTKNDKGKIIFTKYSADDDELSFSTQELILRQIADPYRHPPLFTLKNAIKQIRIYDYFDTTMNSPIRKFSAFTTEKQLKSGGDNLVTILQRLKNDYTLSYEKIEDLLKTINPKFKDITYENRVGQSLLLLREKNLARTVSAAHISDGTLRFLLLLSILYNPERGNLICLDEPEIGLHPDMIDTIAEGIKYAVRQGGQIIIATHSPILLNSFKLDNVLIFEKDKENETVVYGKTEEELNLESDDYLIGQMWLEGKLGGVRW